MPNYTGSALAGAISPDLGQRPGATPILDLPADFEAADALSVNQALQALVNHTAWLYGPRGVAGDYLTPIMPFRNSRGQIISRVDPFGLISGARGFSEDWSTVISEHVTTYITGVDYQPTFGKLADGTFSTASHVNAAWTWSIRNTSSYAAAALIKTVTPQLSYYNRMSSRRAIQVQAPPNEILGAAAVARTTGSWCVAPNVLASLEFTIPYCQPMGNVNVGWFNGAGGQSLEALDADGIFVTCDNPGSGPTHWNLITRGSIGGGATQTDLGVTGAIDNTNPTRFRLVFRGAELDDSSSPRVLAYVNDELKANITSPVPNLGFVPRFGACCRTTTPSFVLPSSIFMLGDVTERHVYLP